MERFVDVNEHVRLWVTESGPVETTPIVLVMGANATAITWPQEFVDRLAQHHRVVRYDHRDTGRSTHAFDERPYALRDLAGDTVAILDALSIERAHVIGMSMGGLLVQLLLLDHPDRLLSATVFGTGALGGASGPAGEASDGELPGPDPQLLEFWETMGDERDLDAELEWRVEHWRLLNGNQLPFDTDTFRDLEEREMQHSGRVDSSMAHALADQSGLERGAELADVTVPTLVIDAPADPIAPPPHAERLAAAINGSRLVTIPGMGHALNALIIEPLADAILAFTSEVDRASGADQPR